MIYDIRNSIKKNQEIPVLIFIGILSRLVPHLPNMTPVGALAIFSGTQYGFKKAFMITTITMLVTDLVIGLHGVMWGTYGSLFVAILLSRLIAGHKNIVTIAGVAATSSVVFFIFTNFAVWLLPHSMYPKTAIGLLECYIMALPFFRNSLIGDFFYTAVFFSGLEAVRAIKVKLAVQER
jgi:hypothetical protein